MIRTAKKLAACVLMLGVLVCGTALRAAAAGPRGQPQSQHRLCGLFDR